MNIPVQGWHQYSNQDSDNSTCRQSSVVGTGYIADKTAAYSKLTTISLVLQTTSSCYFANAEQGVHQPSMTLLLIFAQRLTCLLSIATGCRHG